MSKADDTQRDGGCSPTSSARIATPAEAFVEDLVRLAADVDYAENASVGGGRLKWLAESAVQLKRERDEERQVLRELMPFVLEDYYPDCATLEFRAAVERAKCVLTAEVEAPPSEGVDAELKGELR